MRTPVQLNATDYTQTRITGTHMTFPVDGDTTARLKAVQAGVERDERRFSVLYLILGVAMFLLFGFVAYVWMTGGA